MGMLDRGFFSIVTLHADFFEQSFMFTMHKQAKKHKVFNHVTPHSELDRLENISSANAATSPLHYSVQLDQQWPAYFLEAYALLSKVHSSASPQETYSLHAQELSPSALHLTRFTKTWLDLRHARFTRRPSSLGSLASFNTAPPHTFHVVSASIQAITHHPSRMEWLGVGSKLGVHVYDTKSKEKVKISSCEDVTGLSFLGTSSMALLSRSRGLAVQDIAGAFPSLDFLEGCTSFCEQTTSVMLVGTDQAGIVVVDRRVCD